MKVTSLEIIPEARHIKLVVEMPVARYHTAQVPALPRKLFQVMPTLDKHNCINEGGFTFRKECENTEIPHMFEHMVLDLQNEAQPAERLAGHTEWDWTRDPQGRFRVFIGYRNELLCIGCIRLAEKILASLDNKHLGTINMELEMYRLKNLARLGREFAPFGTDMEGFE